MNLPLGCGRWGGTGRYAGAGTTDSGQPLWIPGSQVAGGDSLSLCR